MTMAQDESYYTISLLPHPLLATPTFGHTHLCPVDYRERSIWILLGELQVGVRLAKQVLRGTGERMHFVLEQHTTRQLDTFLSSPCAEKRSSSMDWFWDTSSARILRGCSYHGY